MVKAVREVSYQYDPALLRRQREGVIPVVLDDRYDVEALFGWYAFAATKFAARVGDKSPADWPTLNSDEDDQPPSLRTLTRIGTGTDEFNSDIDELEPGPVRLIGIGTETPHIVLSLDGPVWRNTQRAQRERGLETIGILSKTSDIELIVPPQFEEFLRNRHPEWVDVHLTESNNTPHPQNPHSEESNEDVDPEAVLDILGQFKPAGGRIQLLAAIPDGEKYTREVRDLKTEEELDLSAGTIDRYYRELEQEHGLLTVDERGRYNSVSLTPSGRFAQELLTEDLHVRHPQQSQLGGSSSTPLNRKQG
ncbi:hypothetical protein [Natronomonas amylolytica]|uniref:hypothetical protein n=1 Tax=Natronomonas amylolytica TaxID=3108498 RepID=UPI00300A8668